MTLPASLYDRDALPLIAKGAVLVPSEHGMQSKGLAPFDALLRHTLIGLRHALGSQLPASSELILSLVICPIEGAGLVLMLRKTHADQISRDALPDWDAHPDLRYLEAYCGGIATSLQIIHAEASCPGRLSAHQRLRHLAAATPHPSRKDPE